MTSTASRTKTLALLALTFVVSFCSFAYEFVYSELLTVMYGGTVTQYVITIGLYFFSLGVGAALSDDLAADARENFFRTEVYLAALAPAGFLLVVALNSVTIPKAVPPEVIWVIARLPVVGVGLLSGFELPLLTGLVDEVGDDRRAVPDRIARPAARLYALVRGAMARFWRVEPRTGGRSGLSLVLAMDYVGGLVGAVAYARALYPRLGLAPTIFALALLNAVAALAFVGVIGRSRVDAEKRASPAEGDRESADTPSAPSISRVLLAACVVLAAVYAGAVVSHDRVDDAVTEVYLEHRIESEYAPGTMAAEITEQETTRYQHLVYYERTWRGAGPNPFFENDTERCLRIGTAVQLCESWADSYHAGLVDVPMTLFEHSPETNVLVVGGGDWIAVDRLRRYDVSVDHVDVDAEFMRRARNDSFFRRWHDDAHEYERLNTTVADGFAHLRRSNETYDLVLLDLPGATDSDLLKFYSEEFYASLRAHLEPDGVVAAWAYSPDGYPEHHKAYVNTVRAAGFDRYAPYWAWEDLDADGERERVERFYLLAPGDRPAPAVDRGSDYVRQHRDRYGDLRWREVPRYDGVGANSIFRPNYDVLVDA